MHAVTRFRRCAPGMVVALVLLSALTAAVHAEPRRHCLWKVTSDRQTLYLQGSLHLLKASDYPLPPALQNAFAACDTLVLEIHLGMAETPEAQMLVLTRGLLTGKQTFGDLVKPETKALVGQCLAGLGADIATFARFKPWFLMLAMTEIKLRKLGFDPELGVDWHFYRKAKEEGKAIQGLETIEYQLGLFDGLGEADQDAMLLQMMKDFDTIEGDLDTIVSAWRGGDMDALEKTLLANFKDYPHLYAKLITQRNAAWMKQLEAFLKGGETVMVVVGVGHFPGPDGLLEQLRKKGYKVEQL